ncbi:hypothetical protein TYRP_020965 [Tyrophagus putrescentiae]|nr:hypothetical protein TYRP_020965 [Tyrophagus putrescentiae]
MILEMMCSNAKLFHLRFLMNRAESSRDMNRVAILKLSVTLPSPMNEDARKRKKSGTKKAAAEAVSPSPSPSRLANTCQHRSITSNYTSIGDDPTEVTTDQANLEDHEDHLHLQHSLISFDDEDCTSSASTSSDDVITSDYSEFSGQEKEEEENIPNRFTSLHCILLLKLYLIMSLLLFAIILLLTFAVRDSSSTGEPPNFSDSSVDNSTSSVDQADESVVFELRIAQQQLNWFAFGFSAYGSVAEADLCLLWFDKRGKLWFDDIKTDNESFVLSDLQSNDCRLIKSGTTHLVWATGPGPLARIEALRLKNSRHGFTRTQLLKPPSAAHLPKLPYYIKKFEVRHSNITVPPVETTYWCRLAKLPEADFSTKNHIVQYEAVIANGSEHLVHHMELFHCEVNTTEVPELPPWNGHCDDPAMPAPLKGLQTRGGRLGDGRLADDMHYNNPDLVGGVVDSSGIRLYYTDHLRQTDAGILEIGLEYTDKNSIPPGVVMDLRGYCVAECTRAALPPFGITIFASQLHTHLTGVRSWTEHVRGGVVVGEVNRDDHYSSHFQEIRALPVPVTVFPGDALVNVCRYDTRRRKNITLGGFGIRDEMCVNYLHYYPKVALEVCKSSVDTAYLRKGPVSDNYRGIEWNAKRAAELDRLYQLAPLSMQCNRSDGRRFPGYWNGVPVTRVTTPLKPKARRCHWTMRKPLQGMLGSGGSGRTGERKDVEEEELKIEGAGHSHRNRKRGRGMYKRSLMANETLEDGKLEEGGEGGEEEEEVEKARMLEIAAEV